MSVGVIEGRENCGIWFDENSSSNHHDAFGLLGTMKHMNNNIACSIAGEDACDFRCRSTGPSYAAGACQNGICVEEHGNYVASHIAWTSEEEPYHAAKVNLFFANVGRNNQGSGGIIYNELDAEAAYEWFLDQEPAARIVNRSVSSTNALINEEVLEDWYARYERMTFVVAAGNAPSEVPVASDCNNLNTICVGASSQGSSGLGPTFNNKFYTNYHHQEMWDLSAWLNQSSVEVEKPDLVALGHLTDVADFDSGANVATAASGTSFTAPTVAGYLALLTEYCWNSVPANPLLYRVLLRLAAWSPHSFEADSDTDTPCPASLGANPLFPTAAYGCDYKSGVGSLDTRQLLFVCGENSSGCGDTADEPCAEHGEEEVAADDLRWGSLSSYPDLQTADAEDFLDNALPLALTRDDPNARVLVLKRWYDPLLAGSRLRAVFAYNSCPTRPSGGTWTSAASVNFDLALCGIDANSDSRCVFISESLHDTNEGFDIIVPFDLDDADLVVIGPPDVDQSGDWPECSDALGNSSRREDWAWATALWGPGIWN